MIRRRSGIFLLALLLLAAGAAASEPAELLAEARRGGVYWLPERSAVERAQLLFERTLGGESGPVLVAAWAEEGFEMLALDRPGQRLLALRELPGRKSGRGFYLLRPAAACRLAWQAPHSFRDLDTGDLALALMLEGEAAAAAWNTVPRDQVLAAGRQQSDLAHQRQSILAAFSRAFARVYPDGRLVQLHGFAAENRRTEAAWQAALILSAGHRDPGSGLRTARSCLGQRLDDPVRLFPDEVRELGGTGNSIGAVLREAGFAGFVHAELALQLRRRLGSNTAARNDFQACFCTGGP